MENFDSISSKESLLTIKLIDFYSDASNLNILLPIILQQTRLSLRSLDWFVTNFSKKYNTNFTNIRNGEPISYFPFKNYKAQLKAYSKKFCDPFCRRERVIFDYKNMTITDFKKDSKVSHENYIITTIGQLNFFRFAIQDSIIKYAIEHIEEIENDMNSTLKNREMEKSEAKKSKNFMEVKSIKRKELSIPGNKSVHITRISAVIKFI
jgi:ADP-dependent phosphofructokinase/glucokinase